MNRKLLAALTAVSLLAPISYAESIDFNHDGVLSQTEIKQYIDSQIHKKHSQSSNNENTSSVGFDFSNLSYD